MAMKIEARAGLLQARAPAGLMYEATTCPAGEVFEDFFAAYDRSFVLENEKEGRSGFLACLALNGGPGYATLSGRYGPFREYVVVVRDGARAVLGGLNFIAFPLEDPDEGGHLLSLNLNYIFVVPGQRRQGVFRSVVGGLPSLAVALFRHTNGQDIPVHWNAGLCPPAVYMFIEQNDPYRMSKEDYARDTQATGLDQLARIAMWARQGAKIVDFPYVQPALTADQQADASLVYAVLGARRDSLHPTLLLQHLQRFFAISVLKGADPSDTAVAHGQLAKLASLQAAGGRVALLAMLPPERLPKPGAGPRAANGRGLRMLLSP